MQAIAYSTVRVTNPQVETTIHAAAMSMSLADGTVNMTELPALHPCGFPYECEIAIVGPMVAGSDFAGTLTTFSDVVLMFGGTFSGIVG